VGLQIELVDDEYHQEEHNPDTGNNKSEYPRLVMRACDLIRA
jgi:hypothetical protein